MAKGKLNPSNEGGQPRQVVEQPAVENKYPGVGTRAYRTEPIEQPVVETPVEETSVEDAQESTAE